MPAICGFCFVFSYPCFRVPRTCLQASSYRVKSLSAFHVFEWCICFVCRPGRFIGLERDLRSDSGCEWQNSYTLMRRWGEVRLNFRSNPIIKTNNEIKY